MAKCCVRDPWAPELRLGKRRALPRRDLQTGARSTVSTMIVCVLNWDGEPNDVARIVIDEHEIALQVTRKSAHQAHAKAGALRAYRIFVRSQAHSVVHYFDDQAVGRLPAARDPNRSWLARRTSMLDRIGQRLTDQQADLRRAFGRQNNPVFQHEADFQGPGIHKRAGRSIGDFAQIGAQFDIFAVSSTGQKPMQPTTASMRTEICSSAWLIYKRSIKASAGNVPISERIRPARIVRLLAMICFDREN